MLLQNIIDSNYHFRSSWVMLLIVLSVLIIGYLFSAFNTRFNSVVKAFFTMRFANQLAREEYSLTHPVSVFLSINFLLTSSLFILQLISTENVFSSDVQLTFPSFLIVILCVIIVYIVKILSLKILGFIFDKQLVAGEYTFNIFLVNQILGIGFIPIIIFIAYGKQSFESGFIYAGIVLMAIAFIIRVGKGAISALTSGEVTLFYLFLYLCTLEILPLLLGFKLIEKLV